MRRGPLIAIALLLVVALGLGVAVALRGPPHAPAATRADIGGPFTLVDQRGKPFDSRALKGKPSLVFFGFTYCPEVCPTTLARLTAWMKTLGPDADRLNVVFITVDPERDTPRALADYLQPFDPRIHGLTGTPAQIAQVAKEYRIYAKKIPLEGGSYTMDHSAGIYGFDRRGDFVELLSYQQADGPALASIHRLLAT